MNAEPITPALFGFVPPKLDMMHACVLCSEAVWASRFPTLPEAKEDDWSDEVHEFLLEDIGDENKWIDALP